MAYRDGNDGLRHRVEKLEAELADAKRTIARLEGKESAASRGTADWLTGAPERSSIERIIERELDDAGLEAIATLARSRLSSPRLTAIGRSLTIATHDAELRVSRTETGETLVRLTHNPIHVRAGLAALVLLGSVFVNFPLAMYTSALLGPAMWLASVVLVLAATVLGARALVSRGQRRTQQNLVGVFEAAGELVKAHGSPLEKRRIAIESTAPSEEAERDASGATRARATSRPPRARQR